MKLYSIRNWNELYENSRSRTVTHLKWVAIPNNHDGEHYSILMQHENAAEIFSAWILILQVASKCTPRGVLIKDDGTPHTDRSLSVKCRCPITWVTASLDYLEKHTDWLETKAMIDGCHPAVTRPSPSYQASAEEGKERREGKGVETDGFLGFPPCLRTDKFNEAWNVWIAHLKEKRKSPTLHTRDLQLRKLGEMGEERAIATITHSVTNGWQGLFEEKKSGAILPKKGRNFAP